MLTTFTNTQISFQNLSLRFVLKIFLRKVFLAFFQHPAWLIAPVNPSDSTTKEMVNTKSLFVYRRDTSLRDILVHSTLLSPADHTQATPAGNRTPATREVGSPWPSTLILLETSCTRNICQVHQRHCTRVREQ